MDNRMILIEFQVSVFSKIHFKFLRYSIPYDKVKWNKELFTCTWLSLVLLMWVGVHDLCFCKFASCIQGGCLYIYTYLCECVSTYIWSGWRKNDSNLLKWTTGIMFTINNTDYSKMLEFRHWVHYLKIFPIDWKSNPFLREKHFISINFNYIYLVIYLWERDACICMPHCMCSGHRITWGSQLSSLLPPFGPWGWNLGHRAWHQVPLPTEPLLSP